MTRWIQLTSGSGYDFDDCVIFGPFTMERDIAHPLAGLVRFVNHTEQKWSVAGHSVAVARTLQSLGFDEDAQAAGLMHDAHEAVIGDIPTPVARHIGHDAFARLKQEVQHAINLRLDIPVERDPYGEHKRAVGLADEAALHVEYRLMMTPGPRDWGVPMPDGVWMLAMHHAVKGVLESGGAFGDRARVLFEQEYKRLFGASEN